MRDGIAERIAELQRQIDELRTIEIPTAGGGAGDMYKSVYDPDGDGQVVSADNADYATSAGDADTVDGYHAADLKAAVSAIEPATLYAGRVWVDIS